MEKSSSDNYTRLGDSHSVYHIRQYLPASAFVQRLSTSKTATDYSQRAAAVKYLSPPLTPPGHNCGPAFELANTINPNRGYFNHPPNVPEETYRIPATQYPASQPASIISSPTTRLETNLPPHLSYPSTYISNHVTDSSMSSTYYVTDALPVPMQYTPSTIPPFNHSGFYYPLPHSFSSGTHKKEIKRRTKSGCLTCRQRRIKCDEKKPDCSHCIKSRRTCVWQNVDIKDTSRRGSRQYQQQSTKAKTCSESYSPITTTAEAVNSSVQPTASYDQTSSEAHVSRTFDFNQLASGRYQKSVPVTLPNFTTIVPADQVSGDYKYPYSTTC